MNFESALANINGRSETYPHRYGSVFYRFFGGRSGSKVVCPPYWPKWFPIVISFIYVFFATQALAQSHSPTLVATSHSVVPVKNQNPQELTPTTASKRSVIAQLKTIQSKQTSLISQIDKKIKAKLKETQDIKVIDDALSGQTHMIRLQESMESLEPKRREALARSQFIDRVIFAIDSKWNANTLKVFLEQSLLDIAAAEINQTDTSKPSELWKFTTYLSVAIRELPEPREDLIAFIDNYMNFSTILEPKSPTAFAQARSYTNGVRSEAARSANREDVGDGIEKKIRDLSPAEPAILQGATMPSLEPTPAPKQLISEPLR